VRKLLLFLIALASIAFGVCLPARAQTPVISVSLSTNDSGDNGITIRTVTPTPLLSGDLGQTTVTFLGPSAGSSCSHSSIGI
jgi:hypothetical protein